LIVTVSVNLSVFEVVAWGVAIAGEMFLAEIV
jgi:hypothetical protein